MTSVPPFVPFVSIRHAGPAANLTRFQTTMGTKDSHSFPGP